MPKLVLNNVNLELSAAAATEALNENWAALEEFAETVLSRDGTPPNQMEDNLDMNGHSIINHITEFGDGVIRKVEDGTPAHTQSLIKDLVFVGATVSSDGSRRAKVTVAPTAFNVAFVQGSTGLPANVQQAIEALDTTVDALIVTVAANAVTAAAASAAAQATANSALAGLTAGATVVTETTTSRSALPAHAGNYTRFTNTSAKTYTFDGGQTWAVGTEFHGRNHGANNLTLTASSGFVLNPPYLGTLVVAPGGTFTVKIVAEDVGDVIGATVAA